MNEQDDIVKYMRRASCLSTWGNERSKKFRSVSDVQRTCGDQHSLLAPILKRNSVDFLLSEERKLGRFLPAVGTAALPLKQIFSAERLLQYVLVDDCNKLRQLIKKVDTQVVSNNIKTVLHEAAYNGCMSCVSLLVKSGFRCDCLDDEKWTPLHAAVISNKIDIVRYFIPLYKNIDVVNIAGISPLHVAVYTNNLYLVHLLVKAGADVFLTRKIMTPFQLAIDLKYTLILDYFILTKSKSF